MGVLSMIKDYYNKNATDMIENTLKLDLQPIYGHFEKYLVPGAKLLDVGFGSGRDSLHFEARGYEVVSIDFAEEVYNRGKNLLNTEVLLVDIQQMHYQNEFDGIWASAVLFHYTTEEITRILESCYTALKAKGYMYISFKYGKDEMNRHGRYFNDFTEEKFSKLMENVDGFEILESWKTQDARPNHQEQYWLNILLAKK